ncbi:MAG: hypothetical protein AAF439_11965 [Pseudomonadota bacterium]
MRAWMVFIALCLLVIVLFFIELQTLAGFVAIAGLIGMKLSGSIATMREIKARRRKIWDDESPD